MLNRIVLKVLECNFKIQSFKRNSRERIFLDKSRCCTLFSG